VSTGDVPAAWLGADIPAVIAAQWNRWEGAGWRKQAYRATNRTDVPDQRFSVHPPGGMCRLHLEFWRKERDRHFDSRTGNRWPGTPGSPFGIIDRDLGRELAWRRAEWDDKAAGQMRLTEDICTSGRSPQCEGPRTCGGCRMMTCRCEQPEVTGELDD
jgi:hypothetical protein